MNLECYLMRIRWLAIVLACSCGYAQIIEPILYRTGDDLAWAADEIDESDWQAMDIRDQDSILQAFPGELSWIRVRFDLPADDGSAKDLCLTMVAAADIYWDGRLVAQNGRPAIDRENEIAGLIDRRIPMPKNLLQEGTHTLAMRVSSHNRKKNRAGFVFYAALQEAAQVPGAISTPTFIRVLAMGMVFLAGITFFLIYGFNRQRSSLFWMGTLCLIVFALVLAESWRSLFGYPYPFHTLRLLFVALLTGLFGLNLNLLLAARFRFPWPRSLLAGLTLCFLSTPVFSETYDGRSMLIMNMTLAAALVQTIRAIWLKRPNSSITIIGLLPCVALSVIDPGGFMDHSFFLAFAFLLVCLLAALAWTMRVERLALEQSRLDAARLECQLLKKSIQPHFMMNTLTSLMEWLEQEPAKAALMVEALACDIRFLTEVSAAKSIPIEKELAMCRSHLKLMAYRNDEDYELETEGLVEHESLPPAIILTLIENGISHSNGSTGAMRFKLMREAGLKGRTYVVDAPGRVQTQEIVDGTGIKYIKARLQESYPGKWLFLHGPKLGAWQTRIEIRS